tara:strand:- start:310 stop:600 length:291 start_codon:yes stop_codon:yes gene_type:complete
MNNSLANFNFPGVTPYPWQREATEAFFRKISASGGSGNFTLIAAPNSGKTFAAAMNMIVARHFFGIKRFIFAAPTKLIKTQAKHDFACLGLKFTSE